MILKRFDDENSGDYSKLFPGSTDNVAWEARGQITVDIKGAGSFTFVLDLYESADFANKRDSSQYPVRLSVQDDIYLEVQLTIQKLFFR